MTKKEMVEMHQVGIGMIFQAFYIIPSLTLIDNVCLPKVFRGEDKVERKAAGIKLLQRFGIAEQADRFESQISGGQKQRVSIARSLINNPDIILADEPVGNLDSVSAENVMEILKDLNEIDKKTIILVTHNPDHLHFADRVIFMKDGKVLREEVHREKRPQAARKEIEVNLSDLSNDLKLLMRTFKNLSATQIGALLVPFKANQMMSHILSDLNEEQIDTANNYLKELLYKNIDLSTFQRSLDLDYEKGGAGWNHLRSESFARRVGEMLSQIDSISSPDEKKALDSTAGYLGNLFKLNIDKESFTRFKSFLKLRLENKLDRIELQQRLDPPNVLGGVGLHKNTAEKLSREMEILMLLKYME
jgi:putative ABC transport system ATP-binding protein